jgi:hypothetical protein
MRTQARSARKRYSNNKNDSAVHSRHQERHQHAAPDSIICSRSRQGPPKGTAGLARSSVRLVLDNCVLGRRCKIRDGESIAHDLELDRTRHHVTDTGIVVVTSSSAANVERPSHKPATHGPCARWRAGAGTLYHGEWPLLGKPPCRESARHDAKHRAHVARPRQARGTGTVARRAPGKNPRTIKRKRTGPSTTKRV